MYQVMKNREIREKPKQKSEERRVMYGYSQKKKFYATLVSIDGDDIDYVATCQLW